jgi:hypothetical protein
MARRVCALERDRAHLVGLLCCLQAAACLLYAGQAGCQIYLVMATLCDKRELQ